MHGVAQRHMHPASPCLQYLIKQHTRMESRHADRQTDGCHGNTARTAQQASAFFQSSQMAAAQLTCKLACPSYKHTGKNYPLAGVAALCVTACNTRMHPSNMHGHTVATQVQRVAATSATPQRLSQLWCTIVGRKCKTQLARHSYRPHRPIQRWARESEGIPAGLTAGQILYNDPWAKT